MRVSGPLANNLNSTPSVPKLATDGAKRELYSRLALH
jgi:hypothetical protein